MVSIKDVAKKAGVSISTVSIIINGKSEERKISKETQKRVFQVMKELNYQPNLSAKKLRFASTKKTVALFWTTDFRDIMLARFLSGLQKQIREKKLEYDIVIYPYENDRLCEEKSLQEMSSFHGAIIANASGKDVAFLETLKPSIPVVLYNRQIVGYPCICVSDDKIARLAWSLLKEKERILLLQAPHAFDGMATRDQTLYTLLLKAGCILTQMKVEENDADHGYILARQIDFQKFDAIYTPSDMIALGILHYCYEHHIRIPEDVEVLAIGNGYPTVDQYLNPSLSIIRIPMEQMAEKCVDILERLFINRDMAPVALFLEPEAVLQGSFSIQNSSIQNSSIQNRQVLPR